MPDNKIKLAIVDDSKFVIESLDAIISSFNDIEIAFSAQSGGELLAELETTEVDIIILDYRMPPGKNGKELSEIIKNKYFNTSILILSMYKELKIVEGCLEAGVDGYLLKEEAGIDELRSAIDCVINNETYFSKTIYNKILAHLRKADDNPKSSILTPTEIVILRLICEQYTTKEIAKKIFRAINTVETHRKHMLERTNCRNSVGLALWAVKEGLLPGFDSYKPS